MRVPASAAVGVTQGSLYTDSRLRASPHPAFPGECSFKKISKTNSGQIKMVEYQHAYFVRGRPDLLPLVIRKTNSTAQTTLESEYGSSGNACRSAARRGAIPLPTGACETWEVGQGHDC
jgi:hypothetical protein